MMRRTGIIIPLLLILSITGCANTPIDTGAAARVTASPTVAATPASTPSIIQLLSGALSSLLAGNYEEAILAYTAIIEIEPKNFDAHLGLGKSYRAAKQPQNAITALETARSLRADDRDMLVELGNAYLDVGSYALAEGVARPLWESASPDMDAGVVLLLSLLAQERIEDVLAMIQDEAFAAHWEERSGEDIVYFGEYNEAGERHGKGVGIYDGYYLYIGDYTNNIRNGQGTWQPINGYNYFTGIWKDDLPNGYGEVYLAGNVSWKGQYINGMENGMMLKYCDFCSEWREYKVEQGKRQWVSDKNITGYGDYNEWGAYINCSVHYLPCRNDKLYGVIPWADFQGQENDPL